MLEMTPNGTATYEIRKAGKGLKPNYLFWQGIWNNDAEMGMGTGKDELVLELEWNQGNW